MRRIALLSISIALVISPGCATLGPPKTQDEQEVQPLPSSRPDLARAFQAVRDWAER
jgi:hypothetical protein